MGELERLEENGLRDLLRAPLDHDDRVVGARDHDIELPLVELDEGRIRDEAAVLHADPHAAQDRPEGDVRERERERGPRDAEDVGRKLLVARQHAARDLHLVPERVGKERPDGPVDHARAERFLLAGTPLALEEAAGYLARGVEFLAVLDAEREEILIRLPVLRRDRGHEHDGAVDADENRPVGLFRHSAGLEVEILAFEIPILLHHSRMSLHTALRIQYRAVRDAAGESVRSCRGTGGYFLIFNSLMIARYLSILLFLR